MNFISAILLFIAYVITIILGFFLFLICQAVKSDTPVVVDIRKEVASQLTVWSFVICHGLEYDNIRHPEQDPTAQRINRGWENVGDWDAEEEWGPNPNWDTGDENQQPHVNYVDDPWDPIPGNPDSSDWVTWLFRHVSQSRLAGVAGRYFSQNFASHFLATHGYEHNAPLEDLSSPTESPPGLLTPESLNGDNGAVIWEVGSDDEFPQ